MLWFEYLALSPSYELARQFRAGDLKISNNNRLPEDFDRVLEVFDDFGDVQRKQFLHWWRELGMQLCSHQGSKPKVTKVAAVSRKSAVLSDTAKALEEYTESDWCEVIQALARHKDISTTQRYIDYNESKLRAAVELVS